MPFILCHKCINSFNHNGIMWYACFIGSYMAISIYKSTALLLCISKSCVECFGKVKGLFQTKKYSMVYEYNDNSKCNVRLFFICR